MKMSMVTGQKGTRYTLALGSLAESSVTKGEYYTNGSFVSGAKDGYWLSLTSKSKDITATYWATPAWAAQNVAPNENTNKVQLIFQDEDLARRVGTAFLHAADLCRKKEVF